MSIKSSVADPDTDPVFFGHPDPDPEKNWLSTA